MLTALAPSMDGLFWVWDSAWTPGQAAELGCTTRALPVKSQWAGWRGPTAWPKPLLSTTS